MTYTQSLHSTAPGNWHRSRPLPVRRPTRRTERATVMTRWRRSRSLPH